MSAKTANPNVIASSDDWRCSKCFKLLGKKSQGYLHIHFARGHQYTVATPVTSVCRCCGKLNTLHS